MQAKKTYQVYHMESMNAEAKLREAERQEEKRACRSAGTEAGPLRKGSLKKGGRLVEKVGLGGSRLCPEALAPGLCPSESWPWQGGGVEQEGRAGSGGLPKLGW